MTKHLRIATWNLQRPGWKSPRVPMIMEQIEAIDADIWILTETHEVINLGEHYACVTSPTQPLRRKGEVTTAIWTRCDLGQTIPTFADQPDEPNPQFQTYALRGPATSPAVCAEVTTPLGAVLVYGTIITWLQDKGPQGDAGYKVEQLHAIEKHRDDWTCIRNGQPMCVAGDFNVTLNGRIWGPREAREKLTEALEDNELNCVTNTFEYCIDHICLSKDWAERVIRREQWQPPTMDGKPVSDHRGSYVDVRLD
ncbi:MAG: endonuclease/exonuclease/phosphatase family protein [Chloroflexota bacterium]|nr:endonuclease/exonuclease/phosphatase family protein [Chloroflexota bacterium]